VVVSAANTAPVASGVTILGTAVVGQTLTGSYSYSDTDGDLEGTSTYRWLRNDVPIGGAAGLGYTLVAADDGQTIKFEVTPVAATGLSPGIAVESAGVVVSAANTAPVASGVTILGTAVVGQTLTGSYSYSDTDDDLEGTSTYRWLRNDVPIGGAAGLDYTLVAADDGQTIKFEVTPVAATGLSPGVAVESAGVVVSATNTAPVASGVTILGTAVVGQTLTGSYSYSDTDGDLEGASTYRWLRNDVPIGGAAGLGYTLVAADDGQTIKFEVTPVAATGLSPGIAVESAGVVVSAANTAPVATITAPANNANVVEGTAVTFTGSANDTEDGNLTANLEWVSDKGGVLGTGASVTVTDLTKGAHTITASVTDSGGATGSAQIVLKVKNAKAGR
jgi:large repetitive protein